MDAPHAASADAVMQGLDATPEGLTSEEAARRLAEHGPNELPEARPPGPLRVLARQFKDVLIWILVGAIGLSVALGDDIEAIAIAIIAAFTVVLGFVQELRAERAMDALRKMSAPEAHVRRGGQDVRVPAREVVPGDVFLVRTGDIVPADGRLLETHALEADESALTGEALPVEKDAEGTVAPDAALGDRSTVLHASTVVARGRGVAVATRTADRSEVGRIGTMLGDVKAARTPLEKQLSRLGRWLVLVATAIVVLVVVLGTLRGEAFTEMLVFGVALAVAAVPEALPAVVTISLAIGAQRMARRHALVRRLPTVETLGSTTVICSDKTGTLTAGHMVLSHVAVHGEAHAFADVQDDERVQVLLEAAVLCSDARLADPHEVQDDGTAPEGEGGPTELAILDGARRAGLDLPALRTANPRDDEVPFTSQDKFMATLHGATGLAKGAPEAILAKCETAWTADGDAPLDDAARRTWDGLARSLMEQGARVLAVARSHDAGEAYHDGMQLIGLVGLRDPPRPAARDAIATCLEAGIRPVMITGDHPETARAIAAELGIPPGTGTVDGPTLEATSDDGLDRMVEGTGIYARVAPQHKLRIVGALQRRGHVVAMTGDGVNDAPALRKADIGVAMGITGTDVAKQAASMTLQDDDFATIVAAVEEGRGIFDNVRKYLVYLLSTNFGELLLIAAALLFGLPLPLTAVMILYVNLASDGLPALALAVDPHEPDLMQRKPRPPGAGLLDRAVIGLMAIGGVWTAAATLGVFLFARASDTAVAEGMTMALATLVLLQFVMGYSFRTERHAITVRPFANKWYNAAIVWEVALLLVVVYVPIANRLIGTSPLAAGQWVPVLLAVGSVVPVLELVKWWHRRSATRDGKGGKGATSASPGSPTGQVRGGAND